MKIVRAFNNVPVEIELTSSEEFELFEEMYLKRTISNLLWALEDAADLDDPDKDDPFSATNILAALHRSPELTKIVARKFDAKIDELYGGREEFDCAVEAYQAVIYGREVSK